MACAVDSARYRRLVRREGRGLVDRWEHPAMDCGERNREEEEHRISSSLHIETTCRKLGDEAAVRVCVERRCYY